MLEDSRRDSVEREGKMQENERQMTQAGMRGRSWAPGPGRGVGMGGRRVLAQREMKERV